MNCAGMPQNTTSKSLKPQIQPSKQSSTVQVFFTHRLQVLSLLLIFKSIVNYIGIGQVSKLLNNAIYRPLQISSGFSVRIQWNTKGVYNRWLEHFTVSSLMCIPVQICHAVTAVVTVLWEVGSSRLSSLPIHPSVPPSFSDNTCP